MTETSGFSSLSVGGDSGGSDLTAVLEQPLQIVLGGRPRQVTHEHRAAAIRLLGSGTVGGSLGGNRSGGALERVDLLVIRFGNRGLLNRGLLSNGLVIRRRVVRRGLGNWGLLGNRLLGNRLVLRGGRVVRRGLGNRGLLDSDRGLLGNGLVVRRGIVRGRLGNGGLLHGGGSLGNGLHGLILAGGVLGRRLSNRGLLGRSNGLGTRDEAGLAAGASNRNGGRSHLGIRGGIRVTHSHLGLLGRASGELSLSDLDSLQRGHVGVEAAIRVRGDLDLSSLACLHSWGHNLSMRF